MEIRLFGDLEAVEGGVTRSVRGPKQRALLALLALQRGEPISGDRLIDTLWGEDTPGNPANSLQSLVAQLRRALGSDAIVTSDAGYALRVRPDDVDIYRFERMIAESRRAAGEGRAPEASSLLAAALSLARGEALAEFAYASFADGERTRITELLLLAFELRAEAELAVGHHEQLVGELEASCRQNPLRERLWELLMLALYRSGRQAEALRAYSEARDRLVDELGIEPGDALRDLEARILAQDPAIAAPKAAPVPAASPTAGNLRERPNSFVGRDGELERLQQAVESSRLVTVIGPGGVGKTRLAVETAATMRSRQRDGAWLVELAGVADSDGVPSAVASTLRAGDALGTGGAGAGSTEDLITQHLAGRSLIVVLDNCEHVIGAAAALASHLVGAVPGLRLIATSREALGVPGEVLVPLGGLASDAAVELFGDRATAVQPAFAVDADSRAAVDDICRRLDGLPLAIELAAARIRALPLSALADRIDDRFRLLTGGARTALPRHQTLRAVVDWSHDLLFEDERRLFARLSVFAGGCDLDAAEGICADDRLPGDEILDLLSRLIDKSLVVSEVSGQTARYSQLQTLWEYARERLAESGEADAIRGRHAAWYLRLAEGARFGLRGADGIAWREKLEADLDNLRAALDWFIDAHDAASALSLVTGLAWLWFVRADSAEGVRWLDDALAVGDPDADRGGLRGLAAVWRALHVANITAPSKAVESCAKAVAALRRSAAPLFLAEGLLLQSEILNRIGDTDGALSSLAEAHPLIVEEKDQWGLALHDMLVAENLAAMGRLDEAIQMARTGVDRCRELGERWIVVEGLSLLASIDEAHGDLEAAFTAYQELVDCAHEARISNFETVGLMRLAALRARQGDDGAAERLFAQAVMTSRRPTYTKAALIGRAAAAQRLGDLESCKRWLDEAMAVPDTAGRDPASATAFIGLTWWAPVLTAD
jgi:predicted ATPase/DNA-binding SARP family transcriptional activator